jgi:hypothetical protein
MDDLAIYRQAIKFWTPENRQSSVALEDDELRPIAHSLSFPTGGSQHQRRIMADGEGPSTRMPNPAWPGYDSAGSYSDSDDEEGEAHSRRENNLISEKNRAQVRGSADEEAQKRDSVPSEENNQDTTEFCISSPDISDVEGDAVGPDEADPVQIIDAATEALPRKQPRNYGSHSVYASSSHGDRSATLGLLTQKPKRLPYTSVGKVYAYNVSEMSSEEPRKHFSAFYIGQPTEISGKHVRRLLTAAHIFDSKDFSKLKYLVFSPESNPSAKYPLYYDDKKGKYRKLISKNYKRGKSSSDICVLFIIIDDGIPEMRKFPIDKELSPLKLVVNMHEYNCSDEKKVIGYPVPDTLGTESKLKTTIGKYTPCRRFEKYERLTVVLETNGLVKNGMSGGPWIFRRKGEHYHAFGIQSRIRPLPKSYALSPDFRESLFAELKLEYSTNFSES